MAETVTITTKAGPFSAYLARPDKSVAPAVVVIQEIFGVNAVMRGICDTLAAAGYAAICPDLFWRIEPGVDITDKTQAEWKRAFELYNAFDVDTGVEDINATIHHIGADRGCTGKVGAVGFCLGGLLAYLTATRTDADASVAFYGVGIERYLGEADRLSAPLMLHIAQEDQFVSRDAQAQIVAALGARAGVTIHGYPGRDHAFARVGGEHFHREDALLARDRTLALFAEAL